MITHLFIFWYFHFEKRERKSHSVSLENLCDVNNFFSLLKILVIWLFHLYSLCLLLSSHRWHSSVHCCDIVSNGIFYNARWLYENIYIFRSVFYLKWKFLLFVCFCIVFRFNFRFSFTAIAIFITQSTFLWSVFDLISFGLGCYYFSSESACFFFDEFGFTRGLGYHRQKKKQRKRKWNKRQQNIIIVFFPSWAPLCEWVSVRSFKEFLYSLRNSWSLIKHFYC